MIIINIFILSFFLFSFLFFFIDSWIKLLLKKEEKNEF